MDKSYLTTVSVSGKTGRNEAAGGENPSGYLAPEVQVCTFVPEKGFALSVQTETLNMGFPEGSEQMEEMYNDANGTTEGLGVDISF